MICVSCVNNGKNFWYDAVSPYEAMKKMRYTLDLKRKDIGCKINTSPSGRHLWMEHSGKTYAAVLK